MEAKLCLLFLLFLLIFSGKTENSTPDWISPRVQNYSGPIIVSVTVSSVIRVTVRVRVSG